MLEKILVLYDLSEMSRNALQWAFSLAEKFHSHVKVLYVLKQPETLLNFEFERHAETLKAQIREAIERDIGLLPNGKDRPQSLEIQVLMGNPFRSLLQSIVSERPDLVIVGSHGRSGLSRVLLGSVAEKILRYSPSPVLVARSYPTWPPKKLLLPVDIGEEPEEQLLLADQFCRELPMQVEMVHAVSLPDLAYIVSDPASFQINLDSGQLEEAAKEVLSGFISKHPALKITAWVRTGAAVSEICETAKERGADLILIPTHGRKGLSRIFMGSVAENVVRYAPCSVLSFIPKHAEAARQKTLEELGLHPTAI